MSDLRCEKLFSSLKYTYGVLVYYAWNFNLVLRTKTKEIESIDAEKNTIKIGVFLILLNLNHLLIALSIYYWFANNILKLCYLHISRACVPECIRRLLLVEVFCGYVYDNICKINRLLHRMEIIEKPRWNIPCVDYISLMEFIVSLRSIFFSRFLHSSVSLTGIRI